MITIQELYSLFLRHPYISTDSRNITDGSIFFALRGERFDGNQHAVEALNKGAAYAVIDDPDLAPQDSRLMLVSNVLQTLQDLASLHRVSLDKPVIGITGTNGKTTTKELVASVLSTSYRILYTEGNLNNHIGVPLTLLRLKEEHDMAVIEMGANKPGDIAELCQIAQPNYGLITNVGEAHLEGFHDLEGVARTKGELYQWLRAHDGKAFRRSDDECLEKLSNNLPCVTYGQSPHATVIGKVQSTPQTLFLHLTWEAPSLKVPKQEQSTMLVGAYNIDNVLSAITIGLFFSVETNRIREAIATYRPTNNRSEYLTTERNELIVDAYNANPSSMKHALDSFINISTHRPRLLIIGDMNELGNASVQAHANIYKLIEPLLDQKTRAIFCGAQWAKLLSESTIAEVFSNQEALAQYLSLHPITDHLIFLKGSNGVGLQKLLPLF